MKTQPAIKPLSRTSPVQSRRIGYAGTGFAFHFHRCRDDAALRDAVLPVVKAAGFDAEPWMQGDPEDPTPVAYFVEDSRPVIAGTIPEADGGNLAEYHIFVTAQKDAETERRHWFHECGHVVSSAWQRYFDKVFPHQGCYETELLELNAYCNELLCLTAEKMVAEDASLTSSGFMECFPWLKNGGAK